MTIPKPSLKTIAKFSALAVAATLFCLFQAIGVELVIIERIVSGVILIVLARYFRSAAIAVFIAFIIPLLYMPVGLEYGSPKSGYIAAVFETNPNEATEFLSIIPIQNFVYAVVLAVLLAFALFFERSRVTPPLPSKQAKIIALVLIIILLFFGSIPYRFYRVIYKSYTVYAALIAKAQATPINDFEIIKFPDEADKDIRIIVIGESVRKDYLSVYGYPLQTTPFLDGANGVFIDAMITVAPTTAAALLPMFTAKDASGKIDWSRTIITLGAQMGYKTYWLSNSGFAGKASSSVSLIALRSNRLVFLNGGESVYSGVLDDLEFLKTFDKILSDDLKYPKLIFIHMAGSHSPACNRLNGFINRFDLSYGKEHNCYLASIEKLDSFIKSLVDRMESQRFNWSLIYFSDHGQGHYKKGGEISLRHDGSVKQGYEVPFFMLDSAAMEHIVIKRHISGLHLIDLFASWLGVKTDKTDARYNFTDFPEDLNITTLDNGAFDDLRDDPALY
jgi:glucan phosphoethanolaminetransferase (alkaline phosphatase superfamily)